jgi:hypothetical protein
MSAPLFVTISLDDIGNRVWTTTQSSKPHPEAFTSQKDHDERKPKQSAKGKKRPDGLKIFPSNFEGNETLKIVIIHD